MACLLRIVLVVLAMWAVPARAQGPEAVTHARIDRSVDRYTVAADLTYVMVSEQQVTLLTQRGLRAGERSARTFYPDKQSLEVVEAWVDQPDGTRVMVPPGSIFTRPSAASQGAPGFTGSLTTTVLFPQLREGSRTHIVWKRTQKAPALLGFNVVNQAALEWATVLDQTEIDIPAEVALHWRARGPFAVSETVEDGRRRIVARITDRAAQEAERNSVATSDFQPMFLATTQPNLEALGALYYRESKDRAAVTPEIQALADRIVGAGTAQEKTGLAAARAIYEWVAGNLRYVAVYLDPEDGWVPHAAAEVLRNGYGDCKDHVILMQALLAARGIRANTAIIDWGSRTVDMPLWVPGQFNHVIIHLPDFDHYANPTDHFAPFDALDRRLSGKTVVLATPEGQVARTPEATPERNRYHLASRFVLDAEGGLSGQARFVLAPNQEIGLRGAVATAPSLRELAERVLAGTAEGGEGSFAASAPRDLSRPLGLEANWTARRAVTFQGDAAFLRVPAGVDVETAARLRAKIAPTGTRRTPMFADAGETVWESTIVLPPGLRAARLPPDVDVRTEAGSYSAAYRAEGQEVRVLRRLVVARNVVVPEAYPAYEALLFAPIEDARAVIELRREE
jgi:transglutaminase-like putative cysteine protease